MHKKMLILLICLLVMFPQSMFASTIHVTDLQFEKIEDNIRTYNPTITQISRQSYDVISKADDTDLKNKQALVTTQIATINATLATVSKVGATYTVADPDRYIGFYAPENVYVYNNSGTWTSISGLTIVTAPVPAGATHEVADIKRLTDYQNYLLVQNYVGQLMTISSTLSTIKEQDVWKVSLQLDQNINKIIVGAQKAYLGFYTILQNRDNLSNQISVMELRLNAIQLQHKLGMISKYDVSNMEAQLKEMKNSLTMLNNQLDSTKQMLNIMLGQDIDTNITLAEPPQVKASDLDQIIFDSDLTQALANSVSVKLNTEEDSYLLDDSKRNFTKSFKDAYKDIQDKRLALSLKQDKLRNEQLKFDQVSLQYKLGIVSRVNYENARVTFLTQQDSLKEAERNLLQSFTLYKWAIKGFIN